MTVFLCILFDYILIFISLLALKLAFSFLKFLTELEMIELTENNPMFWFSDEERPLGED